MKIIKNAIVFSAELPSRELLEAHLKEIPFEPVGETFIHRSGFVLNGVTAELLTPIEGGLSFTVRHDEKILPSAAIATAVHERVIALEEQRGCNLTRPERRIVKDEVLVELIAKALIKSTYVNVFYSEAEQFLIVPTTNKNLANLVCDLLVKACGSVTMKSIRVSDIKQGLTTRLQNYLDGDKKSFEGFRIGDYCLLNDANKNKVTVDIDNLDYAHKGLTEALSALMQVETMALVHGEMSFKLTKEFQLKKIEFFGELTEDEETEREELDGAMLWRTEAAVQMLQLVAALKDLCELFKYKDGDEEAAE